MLALLSAFYRSDDSRLSHGQHLGILYQHFAGQTTVGSLMVSTLALGADNALSSVFFYIHPSSVFLLLWKVPALTPWQQEKLKMPCVFVFKKREKIVCVSYCDNTVGLNTINKIYFFRVSNLQYSSNTLPSIKMSVRRSVGYRHKKSQQWPFRVFGNIRTTAPP